MLRGQTAEQDADADFFREIAQETVLEILGAGRADEMMDRGAVCHSAKGLEKLIFHNDRQPGGFVAGLGLSKAVRFGPISRLSLRDLTETEGWLDTVLKIKELSRGLFMPSRFRKQTVFLTMVLIAIAVGAFVAHRLATSLVLQTGYRQIDEQTQAFADHTYEKYVRLVGLLEKINELDSEFCSDLELQELRVLEFEGLVSDFGRLENGLLHCTTTLGRLPKPIGPFVPDYVASTGVRWYADTDLLASENTKAFILELGRTNLVIDARIVFNHAHPALLHTVVAVDPDKKVILRALGDELPVSVAEAVNAILYDRDPWAFEGFIGAVECHEDSIICILAMQSRQSVLAGHPLLISTFSGLGGVAAGGFICFLYVLFQRQHSLAAKLRKAIHQDRLNVQYQPQVDILKGRVVGAEALRHSEIHWVTGH